MATQPAANGPSRNRRPSSILGSSTILGASRIRLDAPVCRTVSPFGEWGFESLSTHQSFTPV